MTHRPLVAGLSLLGISSLFACGGGGGGPSGFNVSFPSLAPIDGHVDSDGAVFPLLDTVATGDVASKVSRRGFVRFSLTGLPPGAVVTQALLHVHQSAVVGTPYATLGSVFVDHMDIGTALDSSDYASAAFTADFGVLSSDTILAYHTLDVTSAVLADLLAGSSTSDFRLHHLVATDSDGISDYVQWNDGDDSFGSGNVPLLEVTYY